MTPTERLLTILRLVEGQGGETTTRYVRNRMSDEYAGDAGKRKFGRDVHMLRERGLLQTGLPPNRTGLRRMPAPDKPPALHLTEDQHAALARTRRLLRGGLPDVAPVERPDGQPEASMDTALRMLRFVEEHGDEVEVDQLAGWLGLRPAAVWRLLESLMDDLVVLDGRLVWGLATSSHDEAVDGDDGDPGFPAVYILRFPSEEHPLRRRGLVELGFFPYTLAETEDRLGLIAEGLRSAEVDDDTRGHLEGARHKLRLWRRQLLEKPMS